MKRAIVNKPKDTWVLQTEGINVEKMWEPDMVNLLDINKLSCNNIHDMAKYVLPFLHHQLTSVNGPTG